MLWQAHLWAYGRTLALAAQALRFASRRQAPRQRMAITAAWQQRLTCIEFLAHHPLGCSRLTVCKIMSSKPCKLQNASSRP
jgi:hypothetical protein